MAITNIGNNIINLTDLSYALAHITSNFHSDIQGQKDYTDFRVQEALDGLVSALHFKGGLAGTSSSPGAYTPTANIGDVYKVTTAGYINGIKVEVNDTLICTANVAQANSGNYTTVRNSWLIIQGNTDGVVIGPASATNNNIAVFDGTTGKLIKNSGYTIATSVPSGAVFTDTKVTQTATTTNATYELLFSNTANNDTLTEGARKTSTLTYNPSTKALVTGGTVNGYTLAAASAKGVDTSIAANSTSTNLPTSQAVAAFADTILADYARLDGANFTGPVNFGDSVSADDLTAGQLNVGAVTLYGLGSGNVTLSYTQNDSTNYVINLPNEAGTVGLVGKLNGVADVSPEFYAPTTAGSAGYVLQANENAAPTWIEILPVTHGGTGMKTTTNVNAVVIGNSTNAANAMQTVATANGAFYATAANAKPQFGTLPVQQGGTGFTTSTYKNAVVIGNSTTATSALQTVRTASGAFYATAQDGAPTFGTLPVQQGGTGMTTTTNVNAVVIGNSTTANAAMQTVATADGAFYATTANGKPQFGTLPVSQGGTGAKTFTSGALLIGNGTSAVSTRAITNNTTNISITNNNTNIPTMNTIYYGLAQINGASQNRGVSIYAPTTVGTNGQVLSSSGSGAPTWVDSSTVGSKIQIVRW